MVLLILAAGVILQLRRYVKTNDVRHKGHTEIDSILTKNVVELTSITKVHESEINSLKDDVKDVRFEFRIKKTGK